MLLVISIVISLFPASIIIADSNDFVVVTSFNFNDSKDLPSSFVDAIGTASIDTLSFENDLLHKNALRLNGSSTGYAKITANFDQIEPVGNNLYVETEFDLIAQGMYAAGAHITINMANKVKTLYLRCSQAGGLFIGENANGEQLANTKPVTEWTRYKIVMQLTDNNGSVVNKIVGVYANGENTMLNPEASYDFLEPYAKYKSISLQLSKKTGDFALWIDNFSIRQYNSATGESPVPEKTAFGASIVSLKQKLEDHRQVIGDAKYDELSKLVNNLFAVYHNPAANKSQVQNALNDVVLINSAIDEALIPPEDGDYEVLSYFDFDNSDDVPAGFATNTEGAMFMDTITYQNDILHKNVLNLDGSSTAYTNLSYTFDAIPATGKNVYVETEFDIDTFNLAESNANVTLTFGNKVMTLYLRSSGSGGMFIGENADGEQIANTLPMDKWTRYRFVMKLTDENGNPVRKFVGIYANGQNVMLDPQKEYSFITDNDYSKLTFGLSKKSGIYGLCVDNISIIKYSSINGVSPVPHKSELAENITSIHDSLNKYKNVFESGKYSEFTAILSDLVSIYRKPNATISEVTNVVNLSDTIVTEIKEILKEAGIIDDGGDGGNRTYKIHGFENFEGSNNNFTLTDSGGYCSVVNEFADDAFIGNVLKFSNSNDTTVYPSIYFGFDGIPASTAQGASPGTYVETSFDFKSYMTSGKNVTFRFSDGTKNIVTLVLSGQALNLNTYDGTNVASIPNDEWVNLKFVMQMTDTAGNDVRKITAIYANGKNVLVAPVSFAGGNIYNRINVTMSNKKTNDDISLSFGMYFDNFCITSYNSINDVSNAPDRNTLVVKGRKVLQELETKHKDDNKYQEMKDDVIKCAVVYKNPDATAKDIEECINKLGSIENKLNAMSYMKESGEEVYIYEPSLSADSLSNVMKISAYITLVTGKRKGLNATIVGVLFKESDFLYGGELLNVISKPINIDNDTLEQVSLDFDLSSYTSAEKNKMYIKIFLIDNISTASAINTKVYSFFEKKAVIDSSKYYFNDTVNAFMKIDTNNNQKLVITVSVPNNINKSNAVTAVVLKKDIDLDSISGSIENDVEFISQSAADENGKIVFEFTPSSGNGNYLYIVSGKHLDKIYTGKVNYADVNTINEALAELYKYKTVDCLEKYKDIFAINISTYEKAKTGGINISNILSLVLEEKTYTVHSIDEFSNKFNSWLDFVYRVRMASSTDILDLLFKKNYNAIDNGAVLLNLSDNKFYNVCCYILDNAKKVTDLTTLSFLVADAISYVNTNVSTGNSGSKVGGGGGGGGYVSLRKADEEPVTPVEKIKNLFNDIDDVPWAKQAIYTFAAANFINGKSDRIFAPNDIITREEFVKIAVNAFGLYDPNSIAEFKDVSNNSWYYTYVASAVKSGIVKGIDDNLFGVGMAITREEMAVIVHRILVMKKANITEDGVYIEFTDESMFSDYAKEAIIVLAKSGIVNGVGGNAFLPKQSSTRAQAVKMLYEAYKYL